MTNPQNDTPCRDCKRPTQHATEICDDCRTPAGRLVTALEAAGIEDVNHDSSITVSVGCLTIEVYEDNPERWTIEGFDADGITAVDAIAAIVQAPGLWAELDDVREVLMGGEPGSLTDAIQGLAAERVALAAEVKRLREEVAKAEEVKPVADRWSYADPMRTTVRRCAGRIVAEIHANRWDVYDHADELIAHGHHDHGGMRRHAADLALLAAGYRLVGGVHPLPDEVRS